MKGKAIIGTSGWNYKHWGEGVFYPPGLKPERWLSFYASHFDSVEINNTFYRLPPKEVFEAWYKESPPQFSFSVKANRFLTHMKKLANPEEHLVPFLENISGLKEKMRVVLFQLPPFWKFHKERLETFFFFLGNQNFMPGLRSALEVRHKSWYCAECFEILKRFNVALVFADWPGLNIEGPSTADFIFVRRHGYHSLYSTSYPDNYLKKLAADIERWLAKGKDVYVYFNNDVYGYAIKNAFKLKEYIGTQRQ